MASHNQHDDHLDHRHASAAGAVRDPVCYPWTGLLLNPMIASAAMSASSVLVIGNALRLRRVSLG